MLKLGASILLIPTFLWAQSYTATVRGMVTDPTKAAVPSAPVVLKDVNRNLEHTTRTDGAGRYILTALPPGSYALTVEMSGFRTFVQPAFQLEVQQQASIDVELTIGGVTTAVEVSGAAPLVNTAAASLGQVIENKFILTMPLSGRNPMDLVGLTPGLVPPAGGAGLASGVNFISNGVRNNTSDVMLDGTLISGLAPSSVTTMNYTPSVDLVEEFKIQTNFFNAEFGNTGGTVINMVSKSGTNELHGVFYEFRRDNALNANGWFSNRSGGFLTDSKRDIFGGSAGGPVVIPKLYKGSNRTFFFYDLEGTRSISASSTTSSVPTARQKAGDFSDTRRTNGALYTIYNPYDIYTSSDGVTRLRKPFPNNVIPVSMINPISKTIMQYYPDPTSEGNLYTRVNNWYAQGSSRSSSNKMDAKIDHTLSAKQRFTTRYSVGWSPTSDPANLIGNVAGSWTIGDSRTQNGVFDYTRTQSPSTVMSIRLGLTRVRSFSRPGNYGFNSNDLGFPDIIRAGGVYMFPYWSASGYVALGGGQYSYIRRADTLGQLTGTVTKIAGPHTIKTGAETRRQYLNFSQPSAPNAGFSFSRGITGENPLLSNANQGDGFASMLLGWGDNSAQAKWYDSPAAMLTGYMGLYVQDDWRITSKLTLNVGVRYDFQLARTERHNRLEWFDYSSPSPIARKVPALPNQPLMGIFRFADENNRSPFAGDYNNIQPRIGIAYALGSRMSVRAGYGVFYSAGRHGMYGWTGLTFRSISSIQWSRDSSFTQFATLQNPFPLGLTPIHAPDPMKEVGFGTNTFGRYETNPQYQQWNLSIQRELPGNGVLEVNYSASKGTHLYYGDGDLLGNHNKLDPSYWPLGRTLLQSYVPNPFYGIITDPLSSKSLPTVTYQSLLVQYPQYSTVGGYLDPPNIGNSSYQSVQFKYEKRFSKGLALLAHYTIAKNIGDSDSSSSDQVGNTASNIQNWKNLRMERSLSTFDIPQRLIMSFNYQMPVGRGRLLGSHMNKVLNGFIGEWELSGILTFSSGFPIVPGLAASNLLSGTQRPNLIGDPSTSGPASQRIDGYFNVNAFSTPPTDVFGTAARTLPTYRAYGVRTSDMTFMKNFTIHERRSVQVRLEAYNVTNTPCFGAPNATVGSNSFGLITSTSVGARSVQVAAKFYY